MGVSRANVMALIVSEKYDLAKEALNKLIADFSGNSRLPGTLYWIAERYQRQSRFEEANRIYKQIVGNYPDNSYVDKAQLDVKTIDIQILLGVGDVNQATVLLDKFIADFKQHYYANDCLNKIAEQCYLTAVAFKGQKQLEQANYYYAEAESVWQRIINNLPGNLDKAYYYAAVCRKHQGNFSGAIEYFQKVVDKYANSEYAGSAQSAIGLCYEALRDSNAVTAEDSNLLIENYKNLLTKYPDDARNSEILLKLGWLTFRQGRIEEAIPYFENGLANFPVCCKPTDALYVVGRYYQQTGQKERAVNIYEEILKALPEGDPQAEKVKQNLLQITVSIQP
jgi:TolA-binding protein